MPKKQIQKSLQECLSKMKISNKQIQFPIRSCRRPRTPSFAADDEINYDKEDQNDAVTLSDIDQFLFENFRSLYGGGEEEEEASDRDGAKTSAASLFPFEPPHLFGSPPPENLCSSARFFVASGSSSSLIVDEASSSPSSSSSSAAEAAEEAKDPAVAPDDFIALLTYSPSPYDDFRRSMQEMVDARMEHNGRVDWEFVEELLFCYLDLNNRKSYRYILKAFVDLIVELRENSGRPPAVRPSLSGGDGGGGAAWRKQLKGEM